ncbi:hypothetical protein EXIGLDRAFT_187896 [Exidia glandulosa HHB12029]|uniref:Pex19-domain-containing protein n=1 Tax=Exidia glandulosa HHB12029 TaxID=1314781 RepID=A0A165EYR4_EXIGL|nr:hypothetical protein EXIGLDRAFT_187896 [Exidia glandulosa HHB12029]
MEDLMRDLVGGSGDDANATQSAEARADWEQALKDLQDATAAAGGAAEPGASTSAAADAGFQASLRAALDKLKESEDGLKADEADSANADQLAQLQQLLAGLAGEGGEGDGSADDPGQLSGVLEGLMQSLMSKEILYEPLKDLHDKVFFHIVASSYMLIFSCLQYPEYINTHKDSLPADEVTRYTEQSALVGRIVAIFETPGYSDDDPVKSSEVLTLMNEMQAKGSPPTEIMGDMPPGMEMGPDGMPKLPDNCIIS